LEVESAVARWRWLFHSETSDAPYSRETRASIPGRKAVRLSMCNTCAVQCPSLLLGWQCGTMICRSPRFHGLKMLCSPIPTYPVCCDITIKRRTYVRTYLYWFTEIDGLTMQQAATTLRRLGFLDLKTVGIASGSHASLLPNGETVNEYGRSIHSTTSKQKGTTHYHDVHLLASNPTKMTEPTQFLKIY